MKFSFGALFDLWMKFGRLLNRGMTSLIFSLFYFAIVPFFKLMSVILFQAKDRTKKDAHSSWHPVLHRELDGDFFSRMG